MSDQQSASTPLFRDRSFQGMLMTQLLGVFNDNFFKQIVLFVCIEHAQGNRQNDLQGIATIIFSAPFVLLSGYCGYLSDLYSKRTIVVVSKVLEIVVMVLGLIAFLTGQIGVLLAVLGLMGAQSALFGPSKYGILPELFSESDLPRVNGWILMTTFLSIILGFTAAGYVSQWVGNDTWIASLVCIAIAVIGTLTSLMIRRTPAARPEMHFHPSTLFVSSETQRIIGQNRTLLVVLLVSSLFWMTGGVVYPPAINSLGRIQFQLSESYTGLLAACTGLGIAIGCGLGGVWSRNHFHAGLVKFGTGGMLLGLILLGWPGSGPHQTFLGLWGSAAALIWLGLSAGLFTVPLQVYLQAKTPAEHKGRIIGAMNLANWIGICAAGAYYHLLNQVLADRKIPPNAMFWAAGLLLIPVVLFYRPRSEQLTSQPHHEPKNNGETEFRPGEAPVQ